jgi:hypothetical protein
MGVHFGTLKKMTTWIIDVIPKKILEYNIRRKVMSLLKFGLSKSSENA